MKNWFRKIVAMPLMLAMLVCMMQSSVVDASTVCIIKVPMTAQVFVKGVALSDKNLVQVDAKQGRIHEIATSMLGVSYAYNLYMVSNLTSPSDVQVFDKNLIEMPPSYAEDGLIEYVAANTDFAAQVNQRIVDTAIAFHNRVGGYGGNNFGTYFQQGSDAYTTIVASDQGRRWGQYVRAGIIANITVSELYRYTDNAFTAKVSISATSGSGYDEIYDVYFLFQNTGKNYQVTNFTYMK